MKQTSALAKSADCFLLDIGEPVKILDLGRQMVTLSGLSVRDEALPHGHIEVCCVGLRPGEKLYEKLLIGTETEPKAHQKIYRAQER